MAAFLGGLSQGILGGASGTGVGAADVAGASGIDAASLAIPTAYGGGAYGAAIPGLQGLTGAGAAGSLIGQGVGGFGRGYLGFNPASGTSPGLNVPSIGYGLGTLAQGGGGGGGGQMNPQQIMGILRQLVPQQMGPATRILPSGPGAATPHGLLAQIGMGL